MEGVGATLALARAAVVVFCPGRRLYSSITSVLLPDLITTS
jgi:hypothetical protein